MNPPRNLSVRRQRSVAVFALLSMLALTSACGASAADAGVRGISVEAAVSTLEAPPQDLVVLDVRTPEEFDAGHLEGAIMIDFYEPDFRARIAQLDRDVPYLLYCRSGNRSGSAREIMDELGFTDVSDIDGGILSWVDAGQRLVQ